MLRAQNHFLSPSSQVPFSLFLLLSSSSTPSSAETSKCIRHHSQLTPSLHSPRRNQVESSVQNEDMVTHGCCSLVVQAGMEPLSMAVNLNIAPWEPEETKTGPVPILGLSS